MRAPRIVRLYRWLFRMWMPSEFRAALERPALETFEDLYQEARASKERLAVVRLLVRETGGLLLEGWRERSDRRSETPNSLPGRQRSARASIDHVVRDLRLGLRQLRRNRGFTALALAAIALGVGTNTAIFSLANEVFLEPLPYPEPERLGVISTELTQTGSGFAVSYLELRDVSEQNRVFDEVAYFLDWQSVNLSGGDRAERARVNFVTPRYFDMLGFRASKGRLFAPEEGGIEPGEAVVVLSHALWQRNFGGDPDVVGRKVTLNGSPFEVVGVLSAEAADLAQRFDDAAIVYAPIAWVPPLVQLDVWERRNARSFSGLARLRQGVSLQDAMQDLEQISGRLAVDYPDSNEGWRFAIQPVSELLLGDARESTLILLGGAALVLVLVCANLAGLLLLQGIRRSRELAMRRALGAGGRRIVAQLLTESLLVSFIGAVLGTGIAFAATSALSSVDAFRIPGVIALGLDARALGGSVLLATFTGLAFGLAPACRAGRIDSLAALRSGRSLPDRGLARSVFLVSQIALAVVLLAGAVLLFESFRRLHQTDFGFETDRLLSAQLDLRGERYADLDARRAAAERLVERAAALPGAETAFLWSPSRIGGGNWVRFVTRENRYREAQERIEASRHHLLPGTLQQLGISILQGRDFTAADGPGGRPVAIVSRALAERLWPGEDALGRRFDTAVGRDVVAYEVIGVASNARHRSRLNDFLEAEYDLYFSYRQEPERYLGLLVRTADASGASSLVPVMRRLVSEIDPALPIYDVTTMNERMRLEESRSRLSAVLGGAYAALAMALAAVGIYGTLALAVRQRFHEIGIRIALGAHRRSILKQVLGYGVRIFAVGTAIGLAGALAAARLLSSSLYGVTSLDPARLLFVLLGLLLVASAGSILPARQASRVDPTTALRDEA